MSYTQMIMAPTLPFQTGLECIGSVAANFGRTEAEEEHAEYIRLISESRESEHLLRDCGKAVHDNYLALLKAETEKAQLDDKKRRNRKRRHQERCRRIQKAFKDTLRSLNCFSL